MSDIFSRPDAAVRWLRTQLDNRQGGNVLLAGFAGNEPLAAWAAGLRGEQDHSNFITFARFVLQKLHQCNGYWLMLPTVFDQEQCLGYRLDLRSRHGRWRGDVLMPEDQEWQLRAGKEPLLEDLLVPGPALPGIMRRDLQALAERLEVDIGAEDS
ncbi:MAG: hypothetical protein D6720_10240 [Gammaproteobacteria bacterium]|nr:MAG: hypothetical protein D6720_10240 [Gammaproteobacteria bacterium]